MIHQQRCTRAVGLDPIAILKMLLEAMKVAATQRRPDMVKEHL